MVELAIIVLVAAGIGGFLATVQGALKSPDGYSLKKLLSALITTEFIVFGLVNITGLPENASTTVIIGLILSSLILGYGSDKTLSGLDK